MYLTHGDIPI
jgi:hypothetical protein